MTPTQAGAVPSEIPKSELPKQRVLVVDDSRIVRTTISRLIRKSFDVLEEANGEAGWKAISSDPSIVVVFSDIQMPELDGFGLLERVRTSGDARIRSLPVIVISGDEDESTKQRAKKAGANDFITKTTDGTEILARIDNLLRLVEARQQAEISQQTAEKTATHDPVTGAFTPHFLLTEGAKHFAHARRHGGTLSVLTFRMETYAEISEKFGKSIADQLLARIAKLVMGTLRAEDSMGRTGTATFTVIFSGTSSQQAMAFARRMHEQLEKAQVSYRDQVLRIRPSIGLAALDVDPVGSVQDLMKLALQRLEESASRRAQPATAPAAPATPAQQAPAAIPAEIERALQVLERSNPGQLGAAADGILRRMIPFVAAACRRLNIELPVEQITQALKERTK